MQPKKISGETSSIQMIQKTNHESLTTLIQKYFKNCLHTSLQNKILT